MSLEDSPPTPQDQFEVGDKLCVLPPGKMNMVVKGIYEMNRGKYSMFYYVQIFPANPIHGEEERIVINWVPKSREDELVPR